MPSIRNRLIFRIVQKVNGVPVVEYLCQRRQYDSLRKSFAPKALPNHGMNVTFDCFEGFNGPQQKNGMPIQWQHIETLTAGSDLLEY